jgi:hypothetical protein
MDKTNAWQAWRDGRIHELYFLFNASKEVREPANALAMTVGGLANQTCPGPERPGKFRLIALTVTWSDDVEEPGPQLAQAPQEG